MVAESGSSGLTHEEIQAAEGLLRFIDESPSAFHAVSALRARFDEAGFAFLLGQLDKEITKGNAIWWVDYLEDIDVQPETPVHTLLSIALCGDKDDLKWTSRIIEEYAEKGNIESRNALPDLKERLKAASKTVRQATADILKEHGVVSKTDMQRLSDEDGALLYEALKAGIMEEYGISHKRMDKLIGEILK